ncbi:MAG: immune inhibitor A domain-containing protein [Candidatus Hodarchaeales archaeon]
MNKFRFSVQIFLIISSLIIPWTVHPVVSIDVLIPPSPYQSIHKSGSTILTVLVVLMELPDDPYHPTHTIQHYEDLFFSTRGNSINQYYQNTSYGKVVLEGDILGWYQAKENLAYYGAGGRLENVDIRQDYLANESRNQAIKKGKDPQNYDLFVVIHSGDGQEYSGNSDDIWSQKWSLHRFGLSSVEYSINHEFVGYVTPSHELGHELYFPDLYDLNFEHIFAGPYCLMGQGSSHYSIWNKYYSRVSRHDSAQFLSAAHRLQVSNFTTDTIATLNPIALAEPEGIMWLELGWNSSGFSKNTYGRGWTVTIRENLDYDKYLPKHGVIIAAIQVGPRTSSQIQVTSGVSPPWNVIDAHPETSENKDDAAFALSDGEIGTYCSGKGWAIQLIEKYENLSYSLRVTNESNIPKVEIVSPYQPISGSYDILINVTSTTSSTISLSEISIDNGPWQACTPVIGSEGTYSFSCNTTGLREGTHLFRARAADNTSIPYIGYSSFILVEVDNTDGKILVVDDDLGRSSEIHVLNALDELGLMGEYEIKHTTSLTDVEITAEKMMEYQYVVWIGNPAITPIRNSHINYNEFKEIKKYLESSSLKFPPRIIFMSNYNIFDFSNQGTNVHDEIDDIFRARSPTNFRAPVYLLRGENFLKNLSPFTLGPTDSIRANRSSDGEVVTLLPGTVPILEDLNPEFSGYGTKGYYVDSGDYKLINFLFQPESTPTTILPQLLNLSLEYLTQPNNSTFPTNTALLPEPSFSTLEIELLIFIGMLILGGIGISIFIKKRKYYSK